MGFGGERGLLKIEPVQRRFGVGCEFALARQIGGKLLEPAVELLDALLGAGFLALERLARDDEPLQRRRRPGLGVAQRRQAGRDLGLARIGNRLLAGAGGDDADGLVPGVLRLADFGLRGEPAQVKQQRLGAAHLAGNIAIAHRLAGLGFQRSDLRGELADDVFDPGQIVLGGLKAELRFVASRVQAGNAGGFFQHAAALVGPRLDDFADAALVDKRRRARAGRGVGKQHRHIACAHLAAIDAEGRALLAHDATRHFQSFGIVEGRGRLAVAVVDRHRHFGVIARRPPGVAGEDHVVHLGRAHGLVGGFPHDPAHRLDQIGFAAAVRADDPGQPGFDHKVGRFDEGLESDQAQPRELHCECYFHPLDAAAKGIVMGSRRCGAWYPAASARRINRRRSKRNSAVVLSRPSPRPLSCRPCRGGRLASPADGKKPLSFLEIGVDFLGHGLDRQVADQALAVDEKGRRGIDAELVHGVVAHRLDVVEHLLIR